jgi:hypothetical protein
MADEVFIPFKDLCAYLDKVDERELRMRQGRADKHPPKPGLRKRKRVRTRPEELSPNRKRMFEEDENRVLRQMERRDSSFKASTISDTDSN